MDKSTFKREMEFRLGAVARAISEPQDLFTVLTAEPLPFIGRGMRFPSGPAIDIPTMPSQQRLHTDEMDLERWDGLS